MGSIPVAAGASDQKPAFAQARWAEGFTGKDLSTQPAVELLKHAIDREQGRMVVIAIGPLTNLAALLKHFPEERKKIREIVLMGGSIARGYTPGSGPTPEYNIAADAASAQAVFASGIHIQMAPLDVTARLQLDGSHQQEIFARHTPITDALQALYRLWGQPTPTLHDPMAVSLLTDPLLCETKRMDVEIESNGMTTAGHGKSPDATVALQTDPARFIDYYTSLFTH
jgi:inosine-uridine nucleoside N-ribohydrolase